MVIRSPHKFKTDLFLSGHYRKFNYPHWQSGHVVLESKLQRHRHCVTTVTRCWVRYGVRTNLHRLTCCSLLYARYDFPFYNLQPLVARLIRNHPGRHKDPLVHISYQLKISFTLELHLLVPCHFDRFTDNRPANSNRINSSSTGIYLWPHIVPDGVSKRFREIRKDP